VCHAQIYVYVHFRVRIHVPLHTHIHAHVHVHNHADATLASDRAHVHFGRTVLSIPVTPKRGGIATKGANGEERGERD
jgi:hypothetical protein